MKLDILWSVIGFCPGDIKRTLYVSLLVIFIHRLSVESSLCACTFICARVCVSLLRQSRSLMNTSGMMCRDKEEDWGGGGAMRGELVLGVRDVWGSRKNEGGEMKGQIKYTELLFMELTSRAVSLLPAFSRTSRLENILLQILLRQMLAVFWEKHITLAL